ncbi:unnamed protein product [Thelazia callipaeda]|uniref:Uncharacterized protein n=1 Tax=Thelazia callipaeda TaxID=103827 RepID=A0A0N5CMK6_THECL|nr:unnamed protein product [Thelazia callipaeda]
MDEITKTCTDFDTVITKRTVMELSSNDYKSDKESIICTSTISNTDNSSLTSTFNSLSLLNSSNYFIHDKLRENTQSPSLDNNNHSYLPSLIMATPHIEPFDISSQHTVQELDEKRENEKVYEYLLRLTEVRK